MKTKMTNQIKSMKTEHEDDLLNLKNENSTNSR